MASFEKQVSDKKITVKVNGSDHNRRKSMFSRPEFKKKFTTPKEEKNENPENQFKSNPIPTP